MTRRTLLQCLAAAPVAAKVAVDPNIVTIVERIDLTAPGCPVVLVEPSGMVCRFYSSYASHARDAQRTVNWYVGERAERLSLLPRTPRKRYRRIETRFDPKRLPV